MGSRKTEIIVSQGARVIMHPQLEFDACKGKLQIQNKR